MAGKTENGLKLPDTHSYLQSWVFLIVELSPTVLNTGTTNETFQQYQKQHSFRHLLKS